jgi:lambda family phage portal protein
VADDPKPNFFERTLAAISPRLALERAAARERLTHFGFDAANPGTRRGGSGGRAQNAGSETPRMAQDRVKLMWEARNLERNMPVIRCVLDRVTQYVVNQLLYQSQTGDPVWDSQAETYFQDWMDHKADITGRRNFRMLVELGFRSSLRDGDFGFHLVRVGQDLKIQCIESDRIGNPDTVSTMTDDNLIQGIRINSYGAPVGYDIYKRDRKSLRYEFELTADAKNFFLLSKPLRTDEYRTVSWLAPIAAPARDLHEFFAFELGAAKWAASHAGVIRVSDPLARAGAGSAGLNAWKGQSTSTADGTQTEVIESNKLLRLRANEDITPFNPGTRASGAFTAAIEGVLRNIAMGLNVPFGFFDMSRFGGATVRLEAMQLQRMFSRHQEILVTSVLNRVKRAVLQNAMALGHLPVNPNFDKGIWQFGKHLTADTGYDTSANIELLQAGLKPASVIAGEEGLDYEDLIDQMVKEAIILRDKCQQAGIPVEMVALGRFPDASNQLAAAAEAMQPESDPTISDLGDGAAKTIGELQEKVAGGLIPREEAINLLISIYEISPASAEAIIPEPMPTAVAANQPAPPSAPFGGKPKSPGGEAPKVDSPEKP